MGWQTENGSLILPSNNIASKMAYKFIVLSCLVAVARAGLLPVQQYAYSAPQTYTSHAVHAAPITNYAAPIERVEPKAQYSYSYDVQDSHTGDSKSQYETRDGDVVHGSYSVVDPDGTKRTVEYTADPHHGFNAVVHREPVKVTAVAPVAKIAAPVGYATAPIVHSSPVYHSAPAYHGAQQYQAAPVYQSYSSPKYYHH